MRYQITERGDEVEMHVSETGDRAARLLASMQECQEGRCGCPTNQYERLEEMDVQAGDDQVTGLCCVV
jgi:hypothetical protein